MVWDAKTGKPLSEPVTAFGGRFAGPEISDDGKFLLDMPAVNNFPSQYRLRAWELPALKPVGEALPPSFGGCRAIGPGGRFVTILGSPFKTAKPPEIAVRELGTGMSVGKPWILDGMRVIGPGALRFSPDGKHLFIGGGINKPPAYSVKRFDALTGAPVGMPWAHDNYILSVLVSPDGKAAATVSVGGGLFKVRRWDVATDTIVGAPVLIRADTKGVPSRPPGRDYFALHNDARTVAAVAEDNRVQILDLATGKTLCPDLKPGAPIYWLRFSPDGKRLLTVCGDVKGEGVGYVPPGPSYLWDIATGQRIARVPHEGAVSAIAFRLDGRALVTADAKGAVSSWELLAPR
jgi:WD40 repeat protein